MTAPIPSALRRSGAVLLALATVASALLVATPSASASSGRFDLSPGQWAERGTGQSVDDGSVVATFTVPRLDSNLYVGVSARNQGDLGYRAKLRVSSDGAMSAALVRATGGAEEVLARGPVPGSAEPGAAIRVQVAAIGTTSVGVGLRAWRAGTEKPDWTLRATDTSTQRVEQAGEARVWSYLSSVAAQGVSVDYDDVFVSTTAPVGLPGQADADSGQDPTPTQEPTPTPAADGSAKPDAGSTGVRPGSVLTQHWGNITVTEPGTVLENMDIHGLVVIKASNVTIRNSVLRGGRPTTNQGMVTNYGYANLLVEDTDFIPDYETVYQDGVKGRNYTLRRVHITGNVDSAKVQGDNVTIEQSLLENTVQHAQDPHQGGRPSHNDGIQVQRGANVVIRNNTIRGHSNFAILGAASIADTPNLQIQQNWVDGGHCTVKLEERNGHSLAANVSGNKFGPNRKVQSCPLVAVRGVQVTAANNVFEESGKPVSVYWTDY